MKDQLFQKKNRRDSIVKHQPFQHENKNNQNKDKSKTHSLPIFSSYSKAG